MKYTVQFFACPEELAALVDHAVNGLNLVAFAQRRDRSVAVLGGNEADLADCAEIAFRTGPVSPEAADFRSIDWLNRSITLRPGASGVVRDDRGLHESALAWSGADPALDKAAAALQKHLKQQTRTGIVMRNPTNGSEAPSRTLRFSEGARAAALPLIPVAGHNVGRIADEGSEGCDQAGQRG